MSNAKLGSGGKRAVSRHTDQSRATCDRLERSIERLTRRQGKEVIREELRELESAPKGAVSKS